MTDMTPTHWRILRELDGGTLEWGAAVGECWPDLVKHGYAEPSFGGITEAGRLAVLSRSTLMGDTP
jgi:hypothetical protein